jgi:hypothetical protein
VLLKELARFGLLSVGVGLRRNLQVALGLRKFISDIVDTLIGLSIEKDLSDFLLLDGVSRVINLEFHVNFQLFLALLI